MRRPHSSKLRSVLFWILLLTVALSPLPLGGNRPWAWSLLSMLVGLQLVGWGALTLASPVPGLFPPGRVAFSIGMMLLTVCWATFQTILSAPGVVPIPGEGASAGSLPVVGLSLSVFDSGTALMRLLCYAGVFWLSLQYSRSHTRAKKTIKLTIVAIAAYSIYGLALYFTDSTTILWFEKWAYASDLTATFVNRNSFATFAGIGLVCVVSLLLDKSLGDYHSTDTPSIRTRKTINAFLGSGSPLVILVIVIFSALLLSHSRGGAISTLMALLTALYIFIRKSRGQVIPAVTISLVFIVAATSYFTIAGKDLEARFHQPTRWFDVSRAQFYERTVDVIAQNPLRGFGYGTYEDAFRMARDETLFTPVNGTRSWDKAHNTYLENALELGIPAAIALYGSIASLGFICLVGVFRRDRKAVFPIIGVGVTVLVGIHSLIDFSLQIPAVAMTYALIMGVACAQSWEKNGPDADKD